VQQQATSCRSMLVRHRMAGQVAPNTALASPIRRASSWVGDAQSTLAWLSASERPGWLSRVTEAVLAQKQDAAKGFAGTARSPIAYRESQS